MKLLAALKMAAEILNAVIIGDICLKDLIIWMTFEKSTAVPSHFENSDCTRGDFALYFLNFIHEDASRILHASISGFNSMKKQSCVVEGGKHLRCNESVNHENTTNNRRTELFPTSHCKIKSGTGVERLKSTLENIFCVSQSSISNTAVESQPLFKNGNKSEECHPEEAHICNIRQLSPNSCRQVSPTVPSSPSTNADYVSQETFLQNCTLSPISSITSCNSNSFNRIESSNYNYEAELPSNRGYQKGGTNVSLGDFLIRDDRLNNSNKKRGGQNRLWHQGTKSDDNSFDISDESSFPSMGKGTNKLQKRRIKPTRLAGNNSGKSVENSAGFGFGVLSRPTEPSTPFRQLVSTSEDSNSLDFRMLLRHEKLRQQQQQKLITSVPAKVPPCHITPSPSLVDCHHNLNTLGNIYCCLIDTNLVSNMVTELFFIFSLLVVQESTPFPVTSSPKTDSLVGQGQSSIDTHVKMSFFKSIHECVYFATLILNHQRPIFKVLDKAALIMLIENNRILNFLPELHTYLCKLRDSKEVNVGKERTLRTKSLSFGGNVLFQSDTDNRENFPSDQAFHVFKKQRDTFYELLQMWEVNHLSPGWSFGSALGSKVRSLLNMHSNPTNFIHFARLFRAQLLGACRGGANIQEDEGADSMLRSLKEDDPEKFSRLHERLVAPLKSSVCGTGLAFTGQQEFFRDFIVHGAHAVFNQHLIDNLIHEILSLNASNFTASEVEDSATIVDDDTRQAYFNCLSSTRLLAKFLGFVVFLPYRDDSSVPEKVATTQLLIRSKMVCPVDVLSCIESAIHTQKLVLTIPWIVQFLSMLDSISVRLPYYYQVLAKLYRVYRMLSRSMPLQSYMLLQLSLGWLFELPHFPEDLYFSWCFDKELNGLLKTASLKDADHPSTLDMLDIVDSQCLDMCCPFLNELKLLLVTNTGTSGADPVRHITPIPAMFEQLSQSSSVRQLELQLEESFLYSQPSSFRKTVEFVAERVASSCVKHICNLSLKQVKDKSITRLARFIDDSSNKLLTESSAQFHVESTSTSYAKEPLLVAGSPVLQILLQAEVIHEAEQCCCDLRTSCQKRIPTFCQQKSAAALPPLLAEDIPETITRLGIGIAARLSQEKVTMWIHSNITPGLFSKDFNSEIMKMIRNSGKTDILKTSHVLASGGRNVKHKEDVMTPSEVMVHVRELIWQVLGVDRDTVTTEQVQAVLNMLVETARYRCDVIPSAERVMSTLTVDLALALVGYRPELLKHCLLDKFSTIWQLPELSICGPSDCLARLVSPRNIFLLAQVRQNSSMAWVGLASLLAHLLQQKLVTVEEFEEQCVALLQQDWSQDILKHLATCFREIVQQYKSVNQFVLLMDLLAELCQDMEDSYDCC